MVLELDQWPPLFTSTVLINLKLFLTFSNVQFMIFFV